MRTKLTPEVCALITNEARRIKYAPRRRGMLHAIWQAVNVTYQISKKSVQDGLVSYIRTGRCEPKRGELPWLGHTK